MDVLGKVMKSTGLDDEFVPFKKLDAHTPEWAEFTDHYKKQVSNHDYDQQAGIRHRDIAAPNWRNEDLYFCVFADGMPHPVSRKDIWKPELYDFFLKSKRQVMTVYAGELIFDDVEDELGDEDETKQQKDR
tara:strand:+ start:349 stop:741 length:393 start_codon:yes stop_codon:yes gene_type:complete